MKKSFNRLYIHVPFCRSKCGYCAFYSQAQVSDSLVEQYLAKLADELKAQAASCNEIDSIFFGGGTPTWLSASHLELLFALIRDNLKISEFAEISTECNPETLSTDKMAVIEGFCNRISLGIQSFNLQMRQVLQRQGEIESLYHAVELIQNSNIQNFGVDLIYGIPGQSIADWKLDLERAVGLGIKHLSAYALTIEEGTALAGHDIDEETLSDISVDMWEQTETILAEYDFRRYEISNYAKPGFECQHNLEIWYGDTYLGCGPAASSFDGETRWTQLADLNKWLVDDKADMDFLDCESRAREVLVMGLRTVDGWQADKFRDRTGFSWNLWQDRIRELVENGLLLETENALCPTQKGLLFWDEIGMEMI